MHRDKALRCYLREACGPIGVRTLGTAAHVVGAPGQDVPESELREWMEANTPGLLIGDGAALKRILF